MIDLVQREEAVVEQVEQALTATLADEYAAELLQVPIGAPLMRVNCFFFNDLMVPFYAAEILYCAHRYEYRGFAEARTGQGFPAGRLSAGLRRKAPAQYAAKLLRQIGGGLSSRARMQWNGSLSPGSPHQPQGLRLQLGAG
jgi:hypothetical protein